MTPQYRKRLILRMVIFAAIAVAAMVRARFEPSTSSSAPSANAPRDRQESSNSGFPAELPTLEITEPRLAESPASAAISDSVADGKAWQLREVRRDVFESPAGLRYLRGSADAHRIEHVMQHALDDLTKPVHGVFEADRQQILRWIDQAYEQSRKQPDRSKVRQQQQNDRVIVTANMQRRIGYVGGLQGRRQGNPECRYLRLVLQNGNEVITAYPTKSF